MNFITKKMSNPNKKDKDDEEEKKRLLALSCFNTFKVDNPKDKPQTFHRLIQNKKDFLMNFYSRQSYFKEVMGNLQRASRGDPYYHSLVKKGMKVKSPFFKAIFRAIKEMERDQEFTHYEYEKDNKKLLKTYSMSKLELMTKRKKLVDKLFKEKVNEKDREKELRKFYIKKRKEYKKLIESRNKNESKENSLNNSSTNNFFLSQYNNGEKSKESVNRSRSKSKHNKSKDSHENNLGTSFNKSGDSAGNLHLIEDIDNKINNTKSTTINKKNKTKIKPVSKSQDIINENENQIMNQYNNGTEFNEQKNNSTTSDPKSLSQTRNNKVSYNNNVNLSTNKLKNSNSTSNIDSSTFPFSLYNSTSFPLPNISINPTSTYSKNSQIQIPIPNLSNRNKPPKNKFFSQDNFYKNSSFYSNNQNTTYNSNFFYGANSMKSTAMSTVFSPVGRFYHKTFIVDKCLSEMQRADGIVDSVNKYKEKISGVVKENLKKCAKVNNDQLAIEEKGRRKNKYKKLEENNLKELKRKMNAKMSDVYAYQNRKELHKALRVNENAHAYDLYLQEICKINERLRQNKSLEKEKIDKVEGLLDSVYKGNEYLKEKICAYNRAHLLENKPQDFIGNEEMYLIRSNTKEEQKGTLLPKLLKLREICLKKIRVGNDFGKNKEQ